MDRNVIREICEDLCNSFSEFEFRSFYKDIAHGIHHSLPTAGALASLVEEAVELLERHNRIDTAFFLRWRQLRPRRANRITELASMAGAPLRGAPPDEHQIEPVAASTVLQKFSGLELAMRAGGVVYCVYMTYDSRKSPNRALFVSGSFLLGVVLPAALSRGRFAFFVTLIVGAGVILYAQYLETRRMNPGGMNRT